LTHVLIDDLVFGSYVLSEGVLELDVDCVLSFLEELEEELDPTLGWIYVH
jgi:hypothetical protein